jgi:hypothetical protein
MGLLDELRAETTDRSRACAMRRWITDRPDSDQTDLEQAFADPTIGTSTILKVLKRHGFAHGWNSVDRHRKGECSCGNR